MKDRKIVYGVIVSILVLAVCSCGMAAQSTPPAAPPFVDYEREEASAEMAFDGEGYAPATGVDQAIEAVSEVAVERLIIRNAALDLVVADTKATLDAISDLVDELDGFVVESSAYKYQEGLQAHVTLRVPAEDLDAALERIRDLATDVRRESISGQDVTEEYVDLRARLRNREATQARLLQYLEDAEDTEAVLAVDEQLRWVESEIEQLKGRIQYLEESAAMATVTLDITPDELAQPIQIGGWHPEGTLRDAFQSLIRMLQFLVDAAIVIVVLIIPTLAVIALPFMGLFLLVRAIARRRRARKTDRA